MIDYNTAYVIIGTQNIVNICMDYVIIISKNVFIFLHVDTDDETDSGPGLFNRS